MLVRCNMKPPLYDFLSFWERSKIEDLLNNRDLQEMCKRRDIIKYFLQVLFLLISVTLVYSSYHISVLAAIFYWIFIPLALSIGFIISFWYILKIRTKQAKELQCIFSKNITDELSFSEDIKMLKKKYFLEHMQRINFLGNYISIQESGYGAELLTTYMLSNGSSSQECTSNYCFLFKMSLKSKINEKIQIIRIKNSKAKNLILALALNVCLGCLLTLFIWYWSSLLAWVTFYCSYKFFVYSWEYSWEQKSWNCIFDKKYKILWKKTGLVKKLKNKGFFDTFSQIMDKKTTYEIHMQDDVMYVKVDFLRSSPSRLFFIYTNIFNFRSSMATVIDFYIDTIRIQKLKDIIETAYIEKASKL